MKPPTILALTSYFKGQRFLQQAHARGARVFLLTVDRCLKRDWPRESLEDIFALPNEHTVKDLVHTVSYLMRK